MGEREIQGQKEKLGGNEKQGIGKNREEKKKLGEKAKFPNISIEEEDLYNGYRIYWMKSIEEMVPPSTPPPPFLVPSIVQQSCPSFWGTGSLQTRQGHTYIYMSHGPGPAYNLNKSVNIAQYITIQYNSQSWVRAIYSASTGKDL